MRALLTALALITAAPASADTTTIGTRYAHDISMMSNPGANNNYGGSEYVIFGKKSSTVYRAVWRFDHTAIPEGTITEARYAAYEISSSQAASTINCHYILAANTGWTEGTSTGPAETGSVCWNYHTYATTSWAGSAGCSNAGTDYASAVDGTFSTLGSGGWRYMYFDTDVVTAWRDLTTTNAGIICFNSDESTNDASSEMLSDDAATYARIRITYTPPPPAPAMVGHIHPE